MVSPYSRHFVRGHAESILHELVCFTDELHVSVLNSIVDHLHIVTSTVLSYLGWRRRGGEGEGEGEVEEEEEEDNFLSAATMRFFITYYVANVCGNNFRVLRKNHENCIT